MHCDYYVMFLGAQQRIVAKTPEMDFGKKSACTQLSIIWLGHDQKGLSDDAME